VVSVLCWFVWPSVAVVVGLLEKEIDPVV